MSDICDIPENIRKSVAVPQQCAALFIVVGNDPMLKPIPARRWDIPFIEHPGDRPDTEPLGTPLIDLLDHRRCFRVDQEAILVFRVLAISVGGIAADILSVQAFGLQYCAGFHRDILRIVVIYDIFDGCRQFILRMDVMGVVVVIDGNKTNA